MNDTVHTETRHDPKNLLLLLAKTAAVSLVVIIFIGSLVNYYVLSHYVTVYAEGVAVEISQALLTELKPLLFHPSQGSGIVLKINKVDIPSVDRQLRDFLHSFSILKVKIYDTEGRIIYSTDQKIIGRVDEANKRLENALAGNNDSRLEAKEKMLDLAEEQILHADFVETYVPIRSESGKVVGCFEVYENVTKYQHELWRGVVFSTSMLACAVLAVFACSYRLIVNKAKLLNRNWSDL